VRQIPSTQHITDTVAQVRKRLGAAEQDGIFLTVTGHKQDDDWLYITVEPSRPGIRDSEHANFMSKVERELRQQGIDKILLVPALAD
jgi:hypothetical protein